MRLCCFSAWWHIRQRQGGDAEGGWPIPAGPESAQPPATIPQACLLAGRGVHFLSLFTRGRGANRLTAPSPPPLCACTINSGTRYFCFWLQWHTRGQRGPVWCATSATSPGSCGKKHATSRLHKHRIFTCEVRAQKGGVLKKRKPRSQELSQMQTV